MQLPLHRRRMVIAVLLSAAFVAAVLVGTRATADARLIKIGTERTPTEFQYAWGFAALKQDGSVIPWGEMTLTPPAALTDVRRVYTASHCIATLHTNGSVTGWGRAGAYCETDDPALAQRLAGGVVSISSTSGSFAAIKEDGSVVAWGDPSLGGTMSSATENALDGTVDAVRIVGNGLAFAALRADGSVVTWGSAPDGGDSSSVTGLADVVELMPSYFGFVARTRNGAAISWGNNGNNGPAVPTSQAAALLQSGVKRVFANRFTFAAEKLDGSIVPWDWNGQDTRPSGPFTTVEATEGAFAGIRADGSVVTWGDAGTGGNSSVVAGSLASGVVEIMANERAFAARKADGSVVTWGDPGSGGNSSAVAASLSGGVTELAASLWAFGAIRADGTAVAWGDAATGGSVPSTTAMLIAGGRATTIVASDHAFAVVLENGSVAAWGDTRWGGDQDALPAALASGVVRIVNPFDEEPSQPAPEAGGGAAPAPDNGSGAPAAGPSAAASTAAAPAARTLPVQARLAGRRAIAASVRVDGPGRISIIGTAGSVPACRAARSVRKAGTVTLRCRLSKAARSAGPTAIVLTVAFTPRTGSPITGTTTVPLGRR